MSGTNEAAAQGNPYLDIEYLAVARHWKDLLCADGDSYLHGEEQ